MTFELKIFDLEHFNTKVVYNSEFLLSQILWFKYMYVYYIMINDENLKFLLLYHLLCLNKSPMAWQLATRNTCPMAVCCMMSFTLAVVRTYKKSSSRIIDSNIFPDADNK